MLITAILVALAQIMVVKYKQLKDVRDTTKKNQKWYGIIGISIILLFVLTMVVMPYITRLMQ
jgi:branched-subunit amino acid permease